MRYVHNASANGNKYTNTALICIIQIQPLFGIKTDR